MLTRELSSLNALSALLAAFLFFYSSTTSFTGYGYFFDLLTRLNSNESFVGSYYFWWTSLTYVPLFFFGVVGCTAFSIFYAQLRLALLIAVSLFVAYLTEFSDYYPLNHVWWVCDPSLGGLNVLLTNALNRYHPFIFYTSVAVLLTVSFSQVVLVNHVTLKSTVQGSCSALPFFKHTAFINVLALWMGSWWALQEGTWGGWWNWDSSETFGLLVFLVVLHNWHSLSHRRGVYVVRSRYVLSVATLFVSYFFIQLNFDLVSHNFGSKFFFFFNNNLFFLEISLLLLLVIAGTVTGVLWLLRTNWSYGSLRQGGTNTSSPLSLQLPFCVPLIWIFISYKPLLNYFFWNFLTLNVFNFEISIQAINAVAWLAIFTWLSVPFSYYCLLVAALLFMSSTWTWLTLLVTASFLNLRPLHWLVLLFTTVNLLIPTLTLVTWTAETSTIYQLVEDSLILLSSRGVSADISNFEVADSWVAPVSTLTPSWNLFSVSNSPSVNFFELLFTDNTCFNYYNLTTSYVTSYLNLELPFIPALNISGLLVLGLVFVATSEVRENRDF